MSENPLNPGLYHQLRETFGEVKIANEGEPYRGRRRRDPYDSSKWKEETISGGEEYRICCPHCGDTRFRLYVNHKWGTLDAHNMRQWDHLIHCFNEECDLSQFQWLLKPYIRNRPFIAKADFKIAEAKIERVEWPGKCISVGKLQSSHPAVQYLRERRFDPVQLSDLWDVRYCAELRPSPHYAGHLVSGRIIIPVYWDGELVGWQARAIDGSLPKYYTLPGLPKKRILYNGQRARKFSTGVLVEGPTDAWRVGPRAVGILGKSISYFQRELLCDYFKGGTLINILDPDALDDIKRVHKRLRPESFPGKYGIIYLPDGKDPGDCEEAFLAKKIEEAACRLT